MKFLLLLSLFLVACTEKHQQNHLQDQRSPYLQTSQNDEIWWYPWSSKALNYAKNNNKLIFLSIGYASCFACLKAHKELESQTDVAKKLNDHFVSIKVDREERPDLDAYFLNMQTAIMRFGAWPINLILTPNLEPVFATSLMSKLQFLKMLGEVQAVWQKNPEKILNESQTFLEKIKPITDKSIDFTKDEQLIKEFYARYTHRFDTLYGGLGVGRQFFPKFPVNDDMRLLLRYYKKTGEKQALKMVKKTLATMAKSALVDQLEGGIHRYSSTRDWNTPNFEKILTDQAGFINSLSELNLVSSNELYTNTIEKIVSQLLKNFMSPMGGFYSSQAGTFNEQDGFYYTWQDHEVQSLLNKEEQQIFNEHFFLNRPQKQHSQRRSLRLKTSFRREGFTGVINKLLKAKHKKMPPPFDKKIVTSSNAYLISSFAKLGKLWPSQGFAKMIKKNLNFILTQHQDIYGRFFRRSAGGETRFKAVLDDYAFLIDALIEYYQLSFDESYLKIAHDLQIKQDTLFYRSKRKLYSYNQDLNDLPQDEFLFKDQNTPSGQSMSYWNLIRLSRYFYNSEFQKKAEGILQSYPDQLKNDPISYSHLLMALNFELSDAKNIVVSANKERCKKSIEELFKNFLPNTLVSCAHKNSQLKLHKGKKSHSGKKAQFYICNRQSCLAPMESEQEVLQNLQKI